MASEASEGDGWTTAPSRKKKQEAPKAPTNATRPAKSAVMPLSQFIREYKLDHGAAKDLERCAPSARDAVLASDLRGVKNPSGWVIHTLGFMKSLGGPPRYDDAELEELVRRHKLQPSTAWMLRSAARETRSMIKACNLDGLKNADAWIVSALKADWENGAKAAPAPPPAPPVYPGAFGGGDDSWKQGPQPAATKEVPLAVDWEGQCPKDFMRLACGKMPNTAQLANKCRLPLGIVVQPMSLDESHTEPPVPVVNFGACGIIRCKKCRTYINPFVSWLNNGRQWRCNVCGYSNEVPNSYFCHLDESGQRRDRLQRPELCKGCVELVAPGEYMVRPPQPPVYVFVVDVSAAAVACGMVEVAARTIKASLDELPGAPRTQFALLAFDSAVHFFHLKSSLSAPQMLSVRARARARVARSKTRARLFSLL